MSRNLFYCLVSSILKTSWVSRRAWFCTTRLPIDTETSLRHSTFLIVPKPFVCLNSCLVHSKNIVEFSNDVLIILSRGYYSPKMSPGCVFKRRIMNHQRPRGVVKFYEPSASSIIQALVSIPDSSSDYGLLWEANTHESSQPRMIWSFIFIEVSWMEIYQFVRSLYT
jgi:hypothetical protein